MGKSWGKSLCRRFPLVMTTSRPQTRHRPVHRAARPPGAPYINGRLELLEECLGWRIGDAPMFRMSRVRSITADQARTTAISGKGWNALPIRR